MQSFPVVALALLTSLLASACAAPRFAVRAEPAEAVGPGNRGVAVVRVERPWYAPRSVVRGKFHDVLPEYEGLAPLQAKYFTITDGGEFGGIYLWHTRRDAESHFDAAWRAKVREKRGVEADVVIADAPFVIEGRALPHGKPEGSRSIAYPAWASFVRWALPDGADGMASAKRLVELPRNDDALIRAFVVSDRASVGMVALWATREAAENAVGEERRATAGRAAGATSSTFTLFEAPLLIDSELRDRCCRL